MKIQTVAGLKVATMRNPNGGGYIGKGHTAAEASASAMRKAQSSGGHVCCQCMRPHNRTDGGNICTTCSKRYPL